MVSPPIIPPSSSSPLYPPVYIISFSQRKTKHKNKNKKVRNKNIPQKTKVKQTMKKKPI